MFEKSPYLLFDREPEPDAWILFCLHFAGGTAAVFREWPQYAPPGVVICRVQLPGHGTRMGENLLTDMGSVLDGLEDAISPWLSHRFAFFGHSMGGTIAAEWTIRLQESGFSLPKCLFLSASEPTHRKWRPSCRNLSAEAFRAFVFKNGGTPQEVMEHEELMEIFEPILRADYTVLETWSPKPIRFIHVPVVAFAGREDAVVPSEVVSEWEIFAASSWAMKVVPGGHFFIHTQADLLRKSVFDELKFFMEGAKRERNDT